MKGERRGREKEDGVGITPVAGKQILPGNWREAVFLTNWMGGEGNSSSSQWQVSFSHLLLH